MDTSRKLVGGAAVRAAVISVMGMSTLLVAPKCGSDVVVPAEDRTPPAVRLYAIYDTKTIEVPAAGREMRIPSGDKFGVFVEGTDPSGMRRVTITATSEMVCAAGTLDESRREYVVHTERNEVMPGEVGSTMLYTSVPIDGGFSCAHKLSPRSKRFSLFGVAENFHGGVTTTPTLVIEVDLSASPVEPPQ